MPSMVTRHRFTVDEYCRMGEAGVFGDEGRVELLGGEVFTVSPPGSRHTGCVTALQRLLDPVWGEGMLRIQQPLRLGEYSQPEPDLCVVLPRDTWYRDRHPVPSEVLLLVEVSDSSGEHDRDRKLPQYAGAGIPEVWIVDLSAERVEVFREPVDGEYRSHRVVGRGGNITPVSVPDLSLRVEEILF